MKRNIFECWKCRHHNSENPYGIDYCNVYGFRCSFANDGCDDFEPVTNTDGNDIHTESPCRLSVIGWYLLVIAIVVLLGWLLMGCTTTKYVPVTETRTEHHWHTDSVRERDSTHTERETVIREVDSAAMARYGIQMESNQRAWLVLQREMENRLRELEHMTAQRDTVRDSIPVPYPVENQVPTPLTWWQQTRMHVGGIVIFLLIIFVVWKIYVREKR
jgi:hypothetical protein